MFKWCLIVLFFLRTSKLGFEAVLKTIFTFVSSSLYSNVSFVKKNAFVGQYNLQSKVWRTLFLLLTIEKKKLTLKGTERNLW